MATKTERADWQPIETAPRDGTIVLLYIPGLGYQDVDNVQVGFWSDETVGDTDPEGANWYARECSGNPFYERPTHWMPLPAPPQGDSR